MKLKFTRQMKVIAGIGGLALLFTIFLQSAKSQATKDVSGATPIPVGEKTNAVPVQDDRPVIQKTPPAGPPADLKVSPALAEVIKLVQAGVSEDVILAYIANSPNATALTAEEILYLNDLGVSAKVMAALVHSGNNQTNPAPAVAVQQPSVPTTVTTSPSPVAQSIPVVTNIAPVDPPTESATAPTTYITSATSTAPSVNYFYDSLSPYGSWIEIAGYGWCWQPTVAVVNVGWRPYCDRGRWLYSDCGWYWLSDYSWGWAPFHYGRWHHHGHIGWVWAPDTCWGPAWVSWRVAGDYCGWAPLPPEACYRPGFGFTYFNAHVGFSFDFGLSHQYYNFIPVHRFCDYYPSRYVVTSARAHNVYKDSKVINNYIVGNNNTIINQGINVRHVAAATGTEIRHVQIRDHSPSIGRSAKLETLEKQGSQLVVNRPQLPKQPSAAPMLLAKNSAHSLRTDLGPASPSTSTVLSRTEFQKAAPEPASRTEPASHNQRLGRSQSSPTFSNPIETRSGSSVSPQAKFNDPANVTEGVRRLPETRRQSSPSTAQPRSTGNSAPVFRSTPESSPPYRGANSPAVSSQPGPVPSQPLGTGKSQAVRTEPSRTPNLIPNYSRPQATPTPTYQAPIRERTPSASPPVFTPSPVPQYRPAQPAYQSHAPIQSPKSEPIRSPSYSAAPSHQSAVPAPSAAAPAARSQPAPSSSPSSRSGSDRNNR
jgi:hypothetical protein